MIELESFLTNSHNNYLDIKNSNLSIDFKNDILKKCRDQGLDLGAWTINDPEVMKKLEKNGVTLITTDSIEYDK